MNIWNCWNTLYGRGFALVTRSKLQYLQDGVRVYWPGPWLLARFQRWNVQAITIGDNIITTDTSTVTITHEMTHVAQFRNLGPFYLPLYYLASALAYLATGYSYFDNVFELAARRKSGEG